MALVLHGKNLIGGTTSSRGEPVVSAVNPSTGGALEPFFFEATAEEVELAMEMAEEAFDDFRHKSAPQIAAFLDFGDSLAEDQNWGFETARVSAGVEVRFHLPIFPVPLRLIYGWPLRSMTGDRYSNFAFSIGRSF